MEKTMNEDYLSHMQAAKERDEAYWTPDVIRQALNAAAKPNSDGSVGEAGQNPVGLPTKPAPAVDASVRPAYRIVPTHAAADAFWKFWKENGETHKHGCYESTWGAINAALAVAGVRYIDKLPNAKVSGAGTASAGLPG
jgi:hypothetical protein